MSKCVNCLKEINEKEVFCLTCREEVLECAKKKITDLEAKLAESEKKHLIDEKEWQDYCAFKHIEPQIKGCLDREREYEKQLAEKEKEIEYQESMKILAVENQNKKAIEQLEQIINLFEPYENEEKDTILCANNGISFLEYIDNQINELKGKVE